MNQTKFSPYQRYLQHHSDFQDRNSLRVDLGQSYFEEVVVEVLFLELLLKGHEIQGIILHFLCPNLANKEKKKEETMLVTVN